MTARVPRGAPGDFRRRAPRWSTVAVVAAVVAVSPPAQADAAEPAQRVDIIGTTLLPGSGVELRKLPANAQVFGAKDLQRQAAPRLTDFLSDNATALNLAAVQGNPNQPDMVLRGFTASPLLGTPQGISVFIDGVRANEAFGDTVNWDLLAPAAIASIQLIPGSNPAFGLNTLGGAVAVYTKRGASSFAQGPAAYVTLGGGAYGGRSASVEAGGAAGQWDWYVTANDSADNGWAQHNPSHVQQLFAKAGWQDQATDVQLSLQLADNTLEGAQTLPVSFRDIRQAYTWPDSNTNRLAALVLQASRSLTADWLLSGSLYLRSFRNSNLSSNVNPDYQSGDPVQATNDASTIEQNGAGVGAQLSRSGDFAGLPNRLAIGLSYDAARAGYTQSSQDAVFSASRAALGIGAFEPETDARSTTRFSGLFVSDSIDLDARWSLLLAARFNRATVDITDLSGLDPQLNGSHRFQRLNPAIGLNFNPTPATTAYVAYNEGMRAPTAIELTCADPQAPCKLPNSFVSDPPLKMVVSQTFEAGARGRIGEHTTWNAAVFRTDLHDDIQFVSGNALASNAGYFQNVGTTRRQGLEFGVSSRLGALGWAMNYSLVQATYRTGFVESSPSNSTADALGAIVVQPGDHIPGVPLQTFKLRADVDIDVGADAQWNLGIGLNAASSVYARGDENNLDVNGRVGGYVVLNLDTRYQFNRRLSLFARIDNLFNRAYANFGILGDNVFTGPNQTFDGANPRAELFRGYAAPRLFWVGLQYSFD